MHDYYQALTSVLRRLNSAAPVVEVLDHAMDVTAETLRVKGCSILLSSPDRRQFITVAARGLSRRYQAKGPLLADRSVAETREGAPVYIEDAQSDPRVQYPEAARSEGIVSLLSVPLQVRDEVVGAFRVYAGKRREFTTEEQGFLASMADMASLALVSGLPQHDVRGDSALFGQELLAWYGHWELQRRQTRQGARFSHPSEEEFARLLDFYGVRWYYEPRSFLLAAVDGKPEERFTPDFYLPDLDLYVELTTRRQALMALKHRKIRRLRAQYPEVHVILLNRSDYHRLLVRHGYRPIAEAGHEAIERILLGETEIQDRVKELGDAVARDYRGKRPILVGVLKGVIPFMADLVRQARIDLEVEYMAVSSYEGTQSGSLRILKDVTRNLEGRDVLLVEDIVDTGMTLHRLLDHLRSHRPATLEVCALLDKRARRLAEVPLRYVGFSIPDEFVVGYGLDYAEAFRHLPFIGVFRPPPLVPENGQQKRLE